MKLSGTLSADAFQAFQGGFEARGFSGLQNRYTRYLRPSAVRLLWGAGFIDDQLNGKRRADIEGVVSHFVNIRHADGSISERIYSLVIMFEHLDIIGIWTVPSEVFVTGAEDGDDGEDELATKDCPYYICMTRGTKHDCERNKVIVPEDEECPDPREGCPETACAFESGDDEPSGTLDVGQVLGI